MPNLTSFIKLIPAQISQAVYVSPVLKALMQWDATYKGSAADDSYTAHNAAADGFKDVVYGNGGSDYFSTGGGDDKVVVTDNHSTWRGSGNEVAMGATSVDVSDGNDRVTVDAQHGAFLIDLGDGADKATILGGDFIKIMAGNGDFASDTFRFGPDFHGQAVITEANRTADDHSYAGDVFNLQGGHWHANTGDAPLVFTNDLHPEASITVAGFSANQVHQDSSGYWHL